jgi:hypothetical protein
LRRELEPQRAAHLIARTKQNKLPPGEAAFHDLVASYRNGAKARGVGWALTREQVRELMQSDCHYCGAPPSRRRTVKNGDGMFIYNGIDRVDNSEGYTADNVVSCCTTCNFSKGRRSYVEFVQWAARIAAKRGGSAWTPLVA